MGFSLGSLLDPGNMFGGGVGNFANSFFDPGSAIADNLGLLPDFMSDFRNDISGTIDNAVTNITDFETSQLDDFWDKTKKNPLQAVAGGFDPASTKIWNKALGTEWTPYLNQMGGPTQESFKSAANKGVNTDWSQASHAIAGAIAGASATGGLNNALGGLGETAGIGAAGGRMVGGAAINAGNAWANDKDPLKAGLSGLAYQAPGYFNVAGNAGVSNPAYAGFVNRSLGTLGQSAVTGQSAKPGMVSNLGNLFGQAMSTQSTGNNMLNFDTGYDFGSNPMDMQGYPSLTTPGSDYTPSFGSGSDTTQTGSDWEDTLKSLGNNSVIKGLLGLQQPTQPGQPQQQGGGFGSSALGGLAGLYLGNRQNKAVNSQINNLGSLFGQDSPYAQQLRQQLARKDAATGRRSQYGTREVELQARLAELNSRNVPHLQSLYNQQSGNRNLMINTLMNNKGLQGLFKQGMSGLGNYLQPNPYNQALQGSTNMWQSPQDTGYYDANSELFGGTGG